MPQKNPVPFKVLQVLTEPDPTPAKFLIVLDSASDPERHGLVALSRFRIRFFEIKHLYLCYRALQQTDARLRNAPWPQFDWQDIHAMGSFLSFGVAWYDQDFYNSLKNTDHAEAQADMFGTFQLHVDDIWAEHLELCD